jgi:hypothetical protein
MVAQFTLMKEGSSGVIEEEEEEEEENPVRRGRV